MTQAIIQPMGDVVRYRPPGARQETTAMMGMVLFLGAWSMMFAVFFIAYGFMRARLVSWPPEGATPLPWKLPLGNTLVLLLSSASYQLGLKGVRGRGRRPWAWLLGAALLTFHGALEQCIDAELRDRPELGAEERRLLAAGRLILLITHPRLALWLLW